MQPLLYLLSLKKERDAAEHRLYTFSWIKLRKNSVTCFYLSAATKEIEKKKITHQTIAIMSCLSWLTNLMMTLTIDGRIQILKKIMLLFSLMSEMSPEATWSALWDTFRWSHDHLLCHWLPESDYFNYWAVLSFTRFHTDAWHTIFFFLNIPTN